MMRTTSGLGVGLALAVFCVGCSGDDKETTEKDTAGQQADSAIEELVIPTGPCGTTAPVVEQVSISDGGLINGQAVLDIRVVGSSATGALHSFVVGVRVDDTVDGMVGGTELTADQPVYGAHCAVSQMDLTFTVGVTDQGLGSDAPVEVSVTLTDADGLTSDAVIASGTTPAKQPQTPTGGSGGTGGATETGATGTDTTGTDTTGTDTQGATGGTGLATGTTETGVADTGL